MRVKDIRLSCWRIKRDEIHFKCGLCKNIVDDWNHVWKCCRLNLKMRHHRDIKDYLEHLNWGY